MDKIRLHRDQVALVAAVVMPLGVAAILVPFRSSFANTASALILVAVIVAVAALGNRMCGVRGHDLCHRVVRLLPHPPLREARDHPPAGHRDRRESLRRRDHRDRAGGPNRHHHETAVEEADFVGLIHDVSELATSGASSREVVERSAGNSLPSCTFERVATSPARPTNP